MAQTTPRGVRNRNPGNIRRSGSNWQGMAKTQPDPAFVTFRSAEYGVRALARTLLTYQNAHGCRTIRQIVERWAPPGENDTAAYVAHVARCVGADADSEIDVDGVQVMLPLVKAIIAHENGRQPYSDGLLLEGLRMAGVADAKPAPMVSSKRVLAQVGGLAATGASGAVALLDPIQKTTQALQPLAGHSASVGHLVAILTGVAAVLIGLSVWGEFVHRKATGR